MKISNLFVFVSRIVVFLGGVYIGVVVFGRKRLVFVGMDLCMFLVDPLRIQHRQHYYEHVFRCTLPETNIAPEKKPLEKEIPIGNQHF